MIMFLREEESGNLIFFSIFLVCVTQARSQDFFARGEGGGLDFKSLSLATCLCNP